MTSSSADFPPQAPELQQTLSELIPLRSDSAKLLQRFLEISVSLVNGAGCAVLSGTSPPCITAELLSRQALSWSADIREEICSLAAEAGNAGSTRYHPLRQRPEALLFCFPWYNENREKTGMLAFILVPGDQALDGFLLYGSLLASMLGLLLSTSPEKSSQHQEHHHRILELLLDPKPEQALQALPLLLRGMLHCEQAAFGALTASGAVSLETVTDVTRVDRRTTQAKMLEKALLDARVQDRGLANFTIAGFSPSPVIEEVCDAMRLNFGVSLSLKLNAETTGVLFCGWAEHPEPHHIQCLLDVQPTLAAVYHSLCASTRSSFLSLAPEKKKVLSRWRNWAPVCLVAGVLALPLPFTVKADAILVPVTTNYITARFDGILKDVAVQPGDRVHGGQVLCRLDDRDLTIELARLTAEREKSLKLRDQYLGAGNAAQTQIAALDAKRYGEQIKLVESRLQYLQLLSPIDGQILSGDNEKRAGGPVSKGEVLFEVAPTDRLKAELAIREQDISFTSQGQKIDIRFDAYPQKKFTAPLEGVTPRSQIRGSRNVFIGRTALENPTDSLRPGMRGEAHILVGYKSTAWQLFRKPWHTMMRLLDRII